jgi:hypothetical protein
MTEAPATYVMTNIGNITYGIDGDDQYIKVVQVDGDAIDHLDLNMAIARRYRRDSSHPGSYFCHTWDICPLPWRDNEVIAIIHHRFDV